MKQLVLPMIVLVGLSGSAAAQEAPRLEPVVQTKRTPDSWGNVALSGDGKLAVTFDGPTAFLWDCDTGRRIRAFTGHTGIIRGIALSADSKRLLTASLDRTAILWDVSSGKKLQTLPAFPKSSNHRLSVAFSADGKRIATGSWQTVNVWDAASGEKLHTFETVDDWVASLALSSDGKKIVTAGDGSRMGTGSVYLWETATGKQQESYKGIYHCVSMTGDGKHFVGAAVNENAILYETQSGKAVHSFKSHRSYVMAVALSADGRYVLTGSGDKQTIFWDARTGQAVRTLHGHAAEVMSVALSADGVRALTVCANQTPMLWDTSSGKKLHTFQEHTDGFWRAALSQDGKSLAVAGVGVSVWDLVSGKKVRTLRGKESYFQTVALSGDGKRVIAGSRTEEAILWDVPSGKQLRTFPGFDGYFTPRVCVDLTADAQRAVIVSFDSAHLWDVARGEKLKTITDPDLEKALAGTWNTSAKWNSAALSSDGKLVALGGFTKSASLWNLTTGKKLQNFAGHTERIRSIALSRDNKRVLTGADDKTACLWDADTGKKRHVFKDVANVESVALSNDAKLVVTGAGGKATVWDAATGDKLHVLTTGSVGNLVLSEDGKHLWTTSGSVRLWDLTTGKECCRLYSFNMAEDWLVVTPDGQFDGSANAWRFVAYREPGTLKLFDDDAMRKRFYRPGLLAQVGKGER